MSLRKAPLAVLAAVALGMPLSAQESTPWTRVEAPENAGFSRAALEDVAAYIGGLDADAVMVVVGGEVLLDHGDVSEVSYVASARKSVLAMLYGRYVEDGTADLGRTLADLGMDDVGGLLDIERRATVRDLLAARSGVYHPASNPGDNLDSAPERGSQQPGTYYLYSNWDFNAAGGAFEKITGQDIYDALEADLAIPLGFEDWDRDLQRKSGDLSVSEYPAYHMWLSTRDMAKLGELMLREGQWKGEQVVPADWVRQITSVVTPNAELNPEGRRVPPLGYGYMWWVFDPTVTTRCEPQGGYIASGAFGQFIAVLPRADMVVVVKTVPDDATSEDGPSTSLADLYGLIFRLFAARNEPIC